MKVKAYAKINLRLKVLGITTNSYHLLQMVNCKVKLFDELILKKTKLKTIDVDMKEVKKEDNLVYKVASFMFEKYGLPGGIYIKVIKNIPIGAGLAGGSCDAAAVINTLNKMYNLKLTILEKREIALKFGTDIVYCLDDSLALVEGIGDRVSFLKRKIKDDVLIINPNFKLLTKDIFREYDLINNFSIADEKDVLEKKDIESLLENDLEKIVFNKYPEVKKIKEDLLSRNYPKVLMSGSGPTIFVLGNKKSLNKIYKEYKSTRYNVVLTKIK